MTADMVGRNNNLDLIRIVAAGLVILSHSFPFTLAGAAREPLVLFSGGQTTIGSVAVNVFFAISGYLILRSWTRSPKLVPFAARRVLRIYPAFVVCMAICLLVVVPLAIAPYSTVFREGAIAQWRRAVIYLTAYGRDDVFLANPVAGWVNNATYTVQYEFVCYVAVGLAGVLGLLRSRKLLLVAFVAACAWHAYASITGLPMSAGRLEKFIGRLDAWPRFATYFLAGMAYGVYGHRIPRRPWILAGCVLTLAIACRVPHGLLIVMPWAGTYVLFFLAFLDLPRARRLTAWGDFSYGAYLYGAPIQFLIVMWIPTIGPFALFAVSFPAAVIIGALSWHLLEKRFLRPRLRRGSVSGSPDPAAGPSGTTVVEA